VIKVSLGGPLYLAKDVLLLPIVKVMSPGTGKGLCHLIRYTPLRYLQNEGIARATSKVQWRVLTTLLLQLSERKHTTVHRLYTDPRRSCPSVAIYNLYCSYRPFPASLGVNVLQNMRGLCWTSTFQRLEREPHPYVLVNASKSCFPDVSPRINPCVSVALVAH